MTGRTKIIVSGIFLGLLTLSFRGADRPTVTLARYQQRAALRGQWITGYYSAGNGIEPVASIPWNKYTHVNHFAAAPGVSGGAGDGTIELHYLTQAETIQIVAAAHKTGKKILVTIKDNDSYAGAFGQSTAPALVSKFASKIVSFVIANGYDGVDLDWEHQINVPQYADLLKRLRAAMPNKIMTIAAGNWGGLDSVAGESQSLLDQINLMCYDMDSPGTSYSWYNSALTQASNGSVAACDWRARPFTAAGVPAAKIGIGIPFYGRRWAGVTQPLVRGNFSTSVVKYRELVTDGARWQRQYRFYDSVYKSDYLSIPSLDEFISYSGEQSIKDSVAWQKSNRFGGIMTFALEYEYLPAEKGDARYPLSTPLCKEFFGQCP
jgi:chitinase